MPWIAIKYNPAFIRGGSSSCIILLENEQGVVERFADSNIYIRIISLITFVIINSLIGSNYFDRLHAKNKIISLEWGDENRCCHRLLDETAFFITILKYILFIINRKCTLLLLLIFSVIDIYIFTFA